MKPEKRKENNDKQAAEYLGRLANGEIPKLEVTVNYSRDKGTEDKM